MGYAATGREWFTRITAGIPGCLNTFCALVVKCFKAEPFEMCCCLAYWTG